MSRETKRDLSGMDIVLVEESSYLRSILTQLVKTFQPKSLDVHHDEDSAISRLAFAPTDCVLVDWRPEDGIGPKLMKFVRRNTACHSPEAGVVSMASVASRDSVELSRDLGSNVYLTKPFSATDLRKKIEASIFAPRNFVVAEGFVGPDRRHRKASFDGGDRRGNGPLTQNEIDSMMAT
ncbi:response regulator [Pyruvatibacter sp.]|uniref:response regulator n=1 Tax=Pyruvatibacter sp. TaxID=1981328 RepID=UPI0032EDE6CE